ncbi:ABC transporter ATP-binding protein [candidate division WWE3 bacterium]|jgi:putative ABC transport system ATP-binding protein|uniref:ABC transporter ATP-binding protein n=1 Tax=candidate division WWE3 bacterium TaxID=2053526 RepID=A0A3A4ZI01_UNCKA|nr:MAG: ABC transporter ATP-binding protein [candidate division WWE3 bacterium]
MLKIENITKTYNNGDVKTVALDGVSFEIEHGEFVSIMGPSGSGKSTLMHILGALDVPTSGKYVLNGKNVEAMSDDELADIRNKEIGFVFQAYNLLARTSALKNVALPMVYAGLSKKERVERAKEVLEAVGLKDKINNMPNQLSGGQKQRVAIARSLSMKPSIILADEPTGNLPTSQTHEIMDIFSKLNNEGHTIIIITHEEAVASRTKRVITLVDGKIQKDEEKK